MASIKNLDELQATGFLIIQMDSYRTAADQRSIDHPGHGYPSETVYYPRVEYFYGMDELNKRVGELAKQNGFQPQIKVFAITEMPVTINVKVGLG